MSISIGRLLGGITAQLEIDIAEDIEDDKLISRLAMVSESFRNFMQGKLDGFEEGFRIGYDEVIADSLRPSRSRSTSPGSDAFDATHGPKPNDGP